MKHPADKSAAFNKEMIYSVKCLGRCVQSFIAQMGTASVLGVTSKGVFLQNSAGQVVFLSGEVFRGPLTINLGQMVDFKASFAVGEACRITQDRLVFPGCLITIGSDTHVWEPSLIRFGQGGMLQALQRGINLAKLVLDDYEEGLFLPFLARLVADQMLSDPVKLWALIPGWQCGGDLLEGLIGLIGLGRGLTPAGDDFICGFLVARYYTDKKTQHSDHFSNGLLAIAQGKTTSLSAALIRCAAQGEADERVLNALRWLAGVEMDLNRVSQDLQSYGSSSGVDALAGMLAALLPQGAA